MTANLEYGDCMFNMQAYESPPKPYLDTIPEVSTESSSITGRH
jgi:hypothetical protein